mgnify:CR=1 FL=1
MKGNLESGLEKKTLFSEETTESLKDLGEVLLKIHHRLVAEGRVEVKNGKIIIKSK